MMNKKTYSFLAIIFLLILPCIAFAQENSGLYDNSCCHSKVYLFAYLVNNSLLNVFVNTTLIDIYGTNSYCVNVPSNRDYNPDRCKPTFNNNVHKTVTEPD